MFSLTGVNQTNKKDASTDHNKYVSKPQCDVEPDDGDLSDLCDSFAESGGDAEYMPSSSEESDYKDDSVFEGTKSISLHFFHKEKSYFSVFICVSSSLNLKIV